MTPESGDRLEPVRETVATRPTRASRSWIGVIAVAVLVIALGFGIFRGIHERAVAETSLAQTTQEAAIPSVNVVHPEAGAANQEIALPGNVKAFADTPIYARASGYLAHWYFDIGARVKHGDLLAEIETPEVDEQLRQARADLATAQANLDLAESTWKRNQTLYNDKWVSGQVRDNTLGAFTAGKTVVESKQADVMRLQRMQAYEKVYAPFDGVITARNTDFGALIDAGANASARELFHLSATDKVRVFAAVPEIYTRAVGTGTEASVTLDEFPGVSFRGPVVRNANTIDPVTRALTVEVDLDNADGRLLPGAYASVHLTLPSGAHSASVTVPSESVIFRKEGLRVAVVRDGHAQFVPITIGRDYGTKVEVVSGLAPSDEVILNPSDSLTNGTAVRAQPPAPAAAAQ